MDKKEYNEAFKLAPSPKCREMLEGLLQLKSDNCYETVKKIKEYVASYEKALVAAQNLEDVLKLIVESGCPISTVDPAFARGLEYYTGIIFEIYIPELDIALGGGGRYDKLIEAFGGEPTPSVGVAHGLDRIVMALQMQNAPISTDCTKRALVLSVNETLKVEALKIAQLLRGDGVAVEFEVMGRKIGKALEDADKRKVDFAVIVGERELKEGSVMVKNLATREQILVLIKDLPQRIKS